MIYLVQLTGALVRIRLPYSYFYIFNYEYFVIVANKAIFFSLYRV